MSSSSVESRLECLETRVTQLQEELQSMRSAKKDWRRTIGAFTGDEGMQELLSEAMRLREADREKARVGTDDNGRKDG